MINTLGLRRFTSFANAANTLNLACFARMGPLRALLSPTAGMYLGVVFMAFGARKRDAVESLVMKSGTCVPLPRRRRPAAAYRSCLTAALAHRAQLRMRDSAAASPLAR